MLQNCLKVDLNLDESATTTAHGIICFLLIIFCATLSAFVTKNSLETRRVWVSRGFPDDKHCELNNNMETLKVV